MGKFLKWIAEWFMHEAADHGIKWFAHHVLLGGAVAAGLAAMIAFWDGHSRLEVAIYGIVTFVIVVAAVGILKFTINQFRGKKNDPPSAIAPPVPSSPLPPGTQAAGENSNLSYLKDANGNHIYNIVNHFHMAPATNAPTTPPTGEATKTIKDYFTTGITGTNIPAGGLSTQEFPRPARIRLLPGTFELLDADNISSVDKMPQPDGYALVTVQYKEKIPYAVPHIQSTTSTTAVSVTGTSATFRVTPNATIMDVRITGTSTDAPEKINKP